MQYIVYWGSKVGTWASQTPSTGPALNCPISCVTFLVFTKRFDQWCQTWGFAPKFGVLIAFLFFLLNI